MSAGIRPSPRVTRRPTADSAALAATIVALVLSPPSAHAQANATAPPLTLTALLDSVGRTYPLVAAAAQRVQAARGDRTSAGAFGNPVVTWQVEKAPFPGGGAVPGMDREVSAMAMVPLEPLYQRWSRVATFDALTDAARADADATRQQIALAAAGAFRRTAMAQAMVATASDLAGWLDSLVAWNGARVAEGAAAAVDLIRSRVERDRAQADLAMQRAELARSRAALGAFLGAPPAPDAAAAPVVAIDGAPLMLPAEDRAPTTTAAADGRAANLRPDVRAARARERATASAVTTERTNVLRQLSATFGRMTSAGTATMIAGVSAPIPLFDGNRGQLQRTGAERRTAELERVATERAAAADVAGARAAASILTARATALAGGGSDSFLALADESRRIALGAYREGAMPLYQLIDAARAWADARTTYYQVVFAQHESVLNVLVAEGRDLFAGPTLSALHPEGSR